MRVQVLAVVLVILAFCSLWALGCAIFPLFNADRRRLGDLVAGTLVVRAPSAALLPDLTAVAAPRAISRRSISGAAGPDAAPYRFSRERLSHYGECELKTLEDVLRTAGPASKQGLQEITARICRRIGWYDDERVDPVRFLHDFYAAQRAELERRLLLGRRKSDRHQQD